MAKRGENIYKRKDGRYEGRYVVGKTAKGRTRFGYVYGHQYGEVRNSLLLIKAEMVRRRHPKPVCRVSFAEWVEEWWNSNVAGRIKASSRQTYRNMLNRHLFPAFGEYNLSEITPEVIWAYARELEARDYASSTVHGILRLLNSILRSAVEEGLILRNPCRKVHMRSEKVAKQRVLNRREQRAILAQASEKQDIPALLCLYTGMRLGEICALKWEDVNWEQGSILICRTVQRLRSDRENTDRDTRQRQRTSLCVDTPKSSSARRIMPLPGFILEVLRRLEESCGGQGYVFGSDTCPAEPRTVQRRFQALARKSGIEGVHFHSLRHSFATRMLELGIDMKTVSVLMGHSSVRTTLEFYAHSLIENQRAAMDRLAEAFAR